MAEGRLEEEEEALTGERGVEEERARVEMAAGRGGGGGIKEIVGGEGIEVGFVEEGRRKESRRLGEVAEGE